MRRAAVLDCPSLDHSCSCAQRVFPKLRTQVWLSPEEVVDDGFYLRVRLEDLALVPEAMQSALLARHVIDRQDCSQHREKIGVRNGVPAIQIPPHVANCIQRTAFARVPQSRLAPHSKELAKQNFE